MISFKNSVLQGRSPQNGTETIIGATITLNLSKHPPGIENCCHETQPSPCLLPSYSQNSRIISFENYSFRLSDRTDHACI